MQVTNTLIFGSIYAPEVVWVAAKIGIILSGFSLQISLTQRLVTWAEVLNLIITNPILTVSRTYELSW